MRADTFSSFVSPTRILKGSYNFPYAPLWCDSSLIQTFEDLSASLEVGGSRLARCVLSISRVVNFPKCRSARNGISRCSLSRARRSVSDKVSIIPSFSSFSLFVILHDIFIARPRPGVLRLHGSGGQSR